MTEDEDEGAARKVALRERKKAVLRDRIVRNAIDLFTERGYDAVSLDEIVAASLCSRSTFHRYFGTKEDLLFPGAGEWLDGLRATLESVDPTHGDAWAAAREAATAGLTGFLGEMDPDRGAAFVRLWFSEPAPGRRYFEIVMEWESVLRSFFARRLGPGTETDLECQLLASTVSSALRAALNTAMATGEDVHVVAGRSFDLVESGTVLHDLVR